MSGWQEGVLGAHRYLHFAPLTRQGLYHGFLSGSVDARGEEPEIVRALGGLFPSLRLLRQEHGVRIVAADASEEMPMADGWLVDRSVSAVGAVGIRTADCMPVLLAHGRRVALVHVGWRGLAAGILERAARLFEVPLGDELTALVGPCAGGADYQVGEELLREFPVPPVTERRDGALFLDLVRSAERILCAAVPCRVSFHASGISTISDRRFHSHRRDRAQAGRNLSFVALGAPPAVTE